MPALHVRNVPHDVYNALRGRAAGNGRSINAEALAILSAAVTAPPRRSPEEVMERVRRRRAEVEIPKHVPPPEQIIRELRDGGS